MSRRRLVPILAGLVAAAVVIPASAGATTQHAVSKRIASKQGAKPALSKHHRVLRFNGQFTNPTPLPLVSNPLPAGCAVNCNKLSLPVRTTRPFLVSIKNHNGSMDDGLNLFVDDPSGKQVGSADGIGANGQAVTIQPPVKGTYTVEVTETYAYDATTKYRGEARIMSGRSWRHVRCTHSACAMLPRLRARPPSDLHVSGLPPAASTPLGFPFPVALPTKVSCYEDETASTGATRCLRFTSEVDNVGPGQLHLRLPWLTRKNNQPQSGFVGGECRAQQIIDLTNGTTRRRAAGPCEFHAEHGHFHYKAFVGYGLFAVTKSGQTGRLIGRSQKESFCLADDNYAGFAKRSPNGPRAYAGQPGCNLPQTDVTNWPKTGAWVGMGLNPGWGDVYTWDTPDQYIDVTHIPAGTYDIVIETNPSALMKVAGPARTCSRTRITLTATAVKSRSSRRSVTCPPGRIAASSG
jgi:hypothetical protein